MILEFIERILPALAWPIVALIVLPFVVKRTDQLISAIRDAKELSERLPELLETTKTFRNVSEQIEGVRNQILDTFEALERQREIEQAPLEDLTTELADAAQGSKAPEKDKNLTPSQRFVELVRAWKSILTSLDGSYSRLHLGVPDKRSVATAVRSLGDGRRRKPLPTEIVEAATRLQSIYNGFRRATTKEGLTAEVLSNFKNEAERVRQSLDSLGTQA